MNSSSRRFPRPVWWSDLRHRVLCGEAVFGRASGRSDAGRGRRGIKHAGGTARETRERPYLAAPRFQGTRSPVVRAGAHDLRPLRRTGFVPPCGRCMLGRNRALRPFCGPSAPVKLFSWLVFTGVMSSALICAFYLIRERARILKIERPVAPPMWRTSTQASSDPKHCSTCAISASSYGRRKIPAGEYSAHCRGSGAPDTRADFLAFGRWLAPRSAAALDHAIGGTSRKRANLRPGGGDPSRHSRWSFTAQECPRMPFCASYRCRKAQRTQARLNAGEPAHLAPDFDSFMGLGMA